MKTKLLKNLRRDAKFTYRIVRDINIYRILRYNGIDGFSRMLEFNKMKDQ